MHTAGFPDTETFVMRTLGLLAGMSWESTIPYYRQINEAVRDRLGGLHSAKSTLYSTSFAECSPPSRSRTASLI